MDGDSSTTEGVDRDELESRERRTHAANEASWALWALVRAATTADHAFAERLGLPRTDASAVDHVLRASESIGPAELARRIGISSASTSVLIDRLVASGHLQRQPHPTDRRRRVVSATPKAREHALTALQPLLTALDSLGATLGPDETAAVVGYLRAASRIHREYSERVLPPHGEQA